MYDLLNIFKKYITEKVLKMHQPVLPEDDDPITTSVRSFLSVEELLEDWKNLKEYEEIEEGMVIPIAETAGSPVVCGSRRNKQR